MNNTIENYVETVCSCIKWKNYCHAVKIEFENHICGSVDAFIGQGMAEEEAINLALQDMGDPYIIGEQLNEAYQPKCDKMLIFTVAFPIIIFSICEYFAVLEITGDSSHLVKSFVRILAGGLGGFWLFQNDWAGEGKLNKFALNAYISIIIICIILYFFFFTSKVNLINEMLLLLPYLCCCCIDRVKDKKVVGLVIVMVIFMIPIFTAYYVQSFSGMIALTVIGWTICMMIIRNDWLGIAKKGLGYIFVSIPCLGILICSVIMKMDNLRLNQKGFFAWEIMKNSVACGRGGTNVDSYKSIIDYPLTLLAAKYGYIMLVAYVICFIFIILEIIKIYGKQQSFMGKLLIISTLVSFIMEFSFSLLLNLGIPLIKGFTVPFLDFHFGITIKIMQIALIMKMDCFGNYIFSNYSDNRLFDVEGGKIIIYYR